MDPASLFLSDSECAVVLHSGPVQFCVMTSPATHAETEAFFQDHSCFGLTEAQIHFFRQVRASAIHLRLFSA